MTATNTDSTTANYPLLQYRCETGRCQRVVSGYSTEPGYDDARCMCGHRWVRLAPTHPTVAVRFDADASHVYEDDWGEPLPARQAQKLDTMISARFTSSEAELIRAAAETEGTTLSEFVRRAAKTAAIGETGQ